MRIVVLDPHSSDPTWGLAEEAVLVEVPINAGMWEIVNILRERTFGPQDAPVVGLDAAINLAAGLLDLDDMLPEGQDPIVDRLFDEYTRGMANILAELYPVVGMPHAERSDEIQDHIVKAAGFVKAASK